MNKDKILGLLKPYFEQRDDVLMAFLFISWAFDKQCHESDVDIAVYFRPEDGRLELEDSEAIFESEADIWREVEEMLEREVDLLILNRAAPSIAESAISGIPIVIKDRALYIDFMLRVTSEAMDFRQFVTEYWHIMQGARAHAG